ncbi:unnamed protein product [Coregonus sp. 'balchen']|nr:unnamed protein product [Coregonus sp. 'balchen']
MLGFGKLSRNDRVLHLQTEESPKNPSLLENAGKFDDEEDTSVRSVTPTSGTSQSSPMPSSGIEETVDDDHFKSNDFANSKTGLPRTIFGKLVPDQPTTKRRRVKQDPPTSPHPKHPSVDISEGIKVFCRCFTAEYIQINGQVLISVWLWSYSLASCAWCHVRSMPAPFLKNTPGESQRLRLLLKMSRAKGGAWYDSKGQHEYYKTHVNTVPPSSSQRGGSASAMKDLHCLNEREFLNDVIIDFYLK